MTAYLLTGDYSAYADHVTHPFDHVSLTEEGRMRGKTFVWTAVTALAVVVAYDMYKARNA